MNSKEQAIKLLEQIPDRKMHYVLAFLQGAAIPDVEEVEPDEWDLKMIAEAKAENDGEKISFDEMLKRDSLTYADIQG